MQNRLVSENIYRGENQRLPDKDTMKVAFRAAIGDVTPVFIFLQLPQPCEPIQHTYLKLPGMDAIVAFDERIP